MTDYRPRNSDLLYHGHDRSEDGVRLLTIFASVTVVTMLLVTAYLTDAYNPASTGFVAAIPQRVPATALAPPPPALSLAASIASGSPY
jgi:hypothetical protein